MYQKILDKNTFNRWFCFWNRLIMPRKHRYQKQHSIEKSNKMSTITTLNTWHFLHWKQDLARCQRVSWKDWLLWLVCDGIVLSWHRWVLSTWNWRIQASICKWTASTWRARRHNRSNVELRIWWIWDCEWEQWRRACCHINSKQCRNMSNEAAKILFLHEAEAKLPADALHC